MSEASNLDPSMNPDLPPEGDDTPAEPAKRTRKASTPAAKMESPISVVAAQARMTIVLEENDNIPPTGLFLGINGRSYLIRPGEEVDVPEEVLAVLDDAVMSTPKVDGSGNVVDYRNKLRFPYRLLSKGR